MKLWKSFYFRFIWSWSHSHQVFILLLLLLLYHFHRIYFIILFGFFLVFHFLSFSFGFIFAFDFNYVKNSKVLISHFYESFVFFSLLVWLRSRKLIKNDNFACVKFILSKKKNFTWLNLKQKQWSETILCTRKVEWNSKWMNILNRNKIREKKKKTEKTIRIIEFYYKVMT